MDKFCSAAIRFVIFAKKENLTISFHVNDKGRAAEKVSLSRKKKKMWFIEWSQNLFFIKLYRREREREPWRRALSIDLRSGPPFFHEWPPFGVKNRKSPFCTDETTMALLLLLLFLLYIIFHLLSLIYMCFPRRIAREKKKRKLFFFSSGRTDGPNKKERDPIILFEDISVFRRHHRSQGGEFFIGPLNRRNVSVHSILRDLS